MDWLKNSLTTFDNNENAGKAAQIITDRRKDAPECTDRKKHPARDPQCILCGCLRRLLLWRLALILWADCSLKWLMVANGSYYSSKQPRFFVQNFSCTTPS